MCHGLQGVKIPSVDGHARPLEDPNDHASKNPGPGKGGAAQNFNGGLRDWVALTGVPTTGQLERMRAGDNPIAIWGAARIWGYWHFAANSRRRQKEPHVTGHGHDLTYSDSGTRAGHTLPVHVTPAAVVTPTPGQKRWYFRDKTGTSGCRFGVASWLSPRALRSSFGTTPSGRRPGQRVVRPESSADARLRLVRRSLAGQNSLADRALAPEGGPG